MALAEKSAIWRALCADSALTNRPRLTAMTSRIAEVQLMANRVRHMRHSCENAHGKHPVCGISFIG